jgi:hypothetical protein
LLEAASPSRALGASFEDDGTTAYFYALDLAAPERVQAAIHVYDVSSASEGRVQAIEIRWSGDGSRVGLFINGAVNAVFDFDRYLAYSRTQFGLSGRWTRGGWPEDVAGMIS